MAYRVGKIRRIAETLNVLDPIREGLKTFNRRRVRLECGHITIQRFTGRTSPKNTGCAACAIEVQS